MVFWDLAMISDLFIGNFGTEGFVRIIFFTEEERPRLRPEAKLRKPTAEWREFEGVLGAIMRVVRKFPEVLREVQDSLDEEERLWCPT